ncbi:MAG: DegT/DnrJ/EryC1/StrS aminotransferase family protein [Pseudomonadota bacterium]
MAPDSVQPAPPLAFIDLQAQRARIGDKVDQAIARVLDHGRYIMGPEVAAFESQLSEFCGATHAMGVANGTDALSLALVALDLRPGEAVLVPSFTFAATAEVVAYHGAIPVFVDVLADSFNLDPNSLQAGLEQARRQGLTVRGVISVDLFGQPADYAAIEAFCQANDLWLISDAAQSFGARTGDRKVGTIGQITTTSFFPAKPLGCYGDGGAVFTDDPSLAETIKSLRVHGKGTDKYDNVRVGVNSRLDTLQAAILIEKLAIFEDEITARNKVADRYAAIIADVGLAERARAPKLDPANISTWAQYTLTVDGERDAVAARLKERGIPTAVYYPLPLHRQTAYREFPVAGNGLPVSERLSETVLSLPMHPYLAEGDQARVVESLAAALGTA